MKDSVKCMIEDSIFTQLLPDLTSVFRMWECERAQSGGKYMIRRETEFCKCSRALNGCLLGVNGVREWSTISSRVGGYGIKGVGQR